MQVGEQSVRRGIGHGDPEQGRAVTPAVPDQPRRPPGPAFLLLQPPTLVFLVEVRGHHVQNPATQQAQLARTEVLRLLDQVALGQGPDLGGHVVGELVEGPGDHLGLIGVEGARGQGGREAPPAGRQRVRQSLRPAAAPPLGTRPGHQPGSDVTAALVLGHLACGRDQPQAQTLEPRRDTVDGQQCLALVVGREVVDRHVDQARQEVSDGAGRRQHGVTAHGAPPAARHGRTKGSHGVDAGCR